MSEKRLGPCGGFEGAGHFNESNQYENLVKIQGITVWSNGVYIDSLRIEYLKTDGHISHGTKWGEFESEHHKHEFHFDNNEYLYKISGKCARYLDSIKFYTCDLNGNYLKKYPEDDGGIETYIGGSGGVHDYNLEVPPGFHIIGFFGLYARNFEAIGIIFREI